jgi:hypothetical protein
MDEHHWQPQLGDRGYWSADQRLGRVVVPRSEAFLYHWLVMQTGRIVASDNLFETFRRQVLSGPPVPEAAALIRKLNNDAGVLRSFDALPADDRAGRRFFSTLEALDTTTMVPVALLLYTTDVEPKRRARALSAIESYLIRRLLRGLSTKNYSQLAARLVAVAREDLAVADESIVEELLSSGADTFRWPTDEELAAHLGTQSLYGWLGQKRIVYILGHVERAKRTAKSEDLALPTKLEVEHVMPQTWQTHWPTDDPNDPEITQRRNAHINLLGNLTLVTGPLNAAMSNGPWSAKQQGLEEHSLLLLNRELVRTESWDEKQILSRGAALTRLIETIWPGPQHYMPIGWQAVEAESWADEAAMPIGDVVAVYAGASDHLRTMLDRLAAEPGRRWPYGELEAELAWPRGRIAGISGGYGQGMKKRFAGKRPWHVHLTSAGAWEMWMDQERAEAIGGGA